MINPRENLLGTLRRQGFETVPLEPNSFCESQRGAFVKRFGNDDIAAMKEACEEFKP